MKVQWTGLRRPAVPADVAAAIPLEEHERLLAWAVEDGSGVTVVAGRHRLYAVTPGPDGLHLTLSQPWHLVDAGLWSGEDGSLRVTWVDGARPARFVLTDPGLLPETLRERVQASVVISEALDLGSRRTARVVVRQDLTTHALVSQVLLGPGVRSTDPGVSEHGS